MPPNVSDSMCPHLIIDLPSCIGCSACASVCIRGNLAMDMGHPVEIGGGMGCFDCGHCLAICPKGAVRLARWPDFRPEEYDSKDVPVQADAMLGLLRRRRSARWFTDEKVAPEELSVLFEAAASAPSAENSQDVQFVVIDREMRPFMHLISDIMAPREGELPRFAQLREYLDNPFPMGNNPLLWEGPQIVLAFSGHPEDSLIALGRLELMACAMGLGGFYSHWIQMADGQDHGRFMEFFPGIPSDYSLGGAFVIGHPRVGYRRTVPRDPPKVDMR